MLQLQQRIDELIEFHNWLFKLNWKLKTAEKEITSKVQDQEAGYIELTC
jgi:hypothetical protein